MVESRATSSATLRKEIDTRRRKALNLSLALNHEATVKMRIIVIRPSKSRRAYLMSLLLY